MVSENKQGSMCCPECKRCGGITTTEEGKVHCNFCEWQGDKKELIMDNDDFDYHDHEPGID